MSACCTFGTPFSILHVHLGTEMSYTYMYLILLVVPSVLFNALHGNLEFHPTREFLNGETARRLSKQWH